MAFECVRMKRVGASGSVLMYFVMLTRARSVRCRQRPKVGVVGAGEAKFLRDGDCVKG